MAKNNKMSAIPPKKVDIERKKFIEGKQVEIFPWNDSKVREDVKKSFTLVLSEPYMIKLKYLSEQTNKAQQKIAREILCKAIDNLIEETLN